MYRLLIADDEHHIVDWIYRIFSEEEQLQLELFKAYSGIEALNIFKKIKIDIILLDIKMPGLTGLEVAKKVQEISSECKIIFLTGYNDFNFIYSITGNKNMQYLLKTEDDEKIISTVKTVVSSIINEEKDKDIIFQSKKKERLLHFFEQRGILKEILLGEDYKCIQNKIELYKSNFSMDILKPVFLVYANFESNKILEKNIGLNDLVFEMFNIAENLLADRFNIANLDQDKNTVLFFIQPCINENVNWNPLLHLKYEFDRIFLNFELKTSCYTSFLLYNEPVQWKEIYNIYNSMSYFYKVNLSANSACDSVGMIINKSHFEGIYNKIHDNIESFDVDVAIRQLSNSLNKNDKENYFNILERLELSCVEENNFNLLKNSEIRYKIILLLISHINQYGLKDVIEKEIGLNCLYGLHEYVEVRNLFGYFHELSNIIFKISIIDEMDKKEKLVESIKLYIEENIYKDISLTDISEYINYNSSYISRIFKQTTGTNLIIYATQIKIEKSKELLLNTTDTIQSIALLLGFGTAQYFSMVFKKETGISPRDFRINIK